MIEKQRRAPHARVAPIRGVLAMACLAGVAALRIARFAIALFGLAHECGPLSACLFGIAVIALPLRLPVRIGAFLTALLIWHWPALAALLLAAPRLLLMLPGLIATALSTLRHPPPRWPPGRPVSVAGR
jgi:hypothetical protein